MYLWRAVDHEGEILDMLVPRRRDKRAALRLTRKLLKKQGFAPKVVVTDKLGSYRAAFRQLRLGCPHERGLRKNNRNREPEPTRAGFEHSIARWRCLRRPPVWLGEQTTDMLHLKSLSLMEPIGLP